jgi:hypothetical protein
MGGLWCAPIQFWSCVALININMVVIIIFIIRIGKKLRKGLFMVTIGETDLFILFFIKNVFFILQTHTLRKVAKTTPFRRKLPITP